MFFCLGLGLVAQRGPGGFGGRGGAGFGFSGVELPPQILKQLNLTDAQVAQVRAIEKTAMQGDLGAALKARGDAQHALDLLVWSQTSNVQAFAAAAQTLAMQATQVAMAQHQMALAVEAVLTEAQRTQLEALVAAPGRGRGRRGGGGSGGGGSSHP